MIQDKLNFKSKVYFYYFLLFFFNEKKMQVYDTHSLHILIVAVFRLLSGEEWNIWRRIKSVYMNYYVCIKLKRNCFCEKKIPFKIKYSTLDSWFNYLYYLNYCKYNLHKF